MVLLNPNQFLVGENPLPEVAAGASAYRRRADLPEPRSGYASTTITRPAQRAVADAYDRLPEFDDRAIPSFRALADETGRQFDFVTRPRSKRGLGLNIEVTKHDPYGGSGDYHDITGELRDDVLNHDRLKVYSTASTGGHPYFTNDENDMFRGVHDLFGHLGAGRGVDAHGEEAAYQHHASMFSPLARGALATETRGQNASLHKNGGFQVQKVALLPEHLQEAQFGRIGTLADRLGAAEEARLEHLRQNLL